MEWPSGPEELVREQQRLRAATWEQMIRPAAEMVVGGVFVCFGRGGAGPGGRGDEGWIAAVTMSGSRIISTAVAAGVAGAPYLPGLLALREGALLEHAVRMLAEPPSVLLVNATGRDHPRRAGLALHLGAVLDVATVGVTHRPLCAAGRWPASDRRGATSALRLGGETVGLWLRTVPGRRPVAVHAGWRTDPQTAADVVLAGGGAMRTPEPLRQARRLARTARNRNDAPAEVSDG